MGFITPKANIVDFKNHVLGHDIKGFIASATPIHVMKPFRPWPRVPYLDSKK
jgi:hypothetical protein